MNDIFMAKGNENDWWLCSTYLKPNTEFVNAIKPVLIR